MERKEHRVPSQMESGGLHMGTFIQLQWVGGSQQLFDADQHQIVAGSAKEGKMMS